VGSKLNKLFINNNNTIFFIFAWILKETILKIIKKSQLKKFLTIKYLIIKQITVKDSLENSDCKCLFFFIEEYVHIYTLITCSVKN